MIFGRPAKTRWGHLSQWHLWFAWRPVRLADGRFAWLEWIDRRIENLFCLDEWFTTRYYRQHLIEEKP